MHQNPQGPSCASTWHGVVQAGTAWHRPSLEDSAAFTVPSSTQIAKKSIQALQVLPPPPYISFLPHLPSTDSHINYSFFLVSSIYDWSRMEALAGWPSLIPSALPATSLPATTCPLYLSSLCLLIPQPKALHTHGDKYHLRRHPPTPAPEERELRGGFPSHRPPRSSSVHLSDTLIILPFAPFF